MYLQGTREETRSRPASAARVWRQERDGVAGGERGLGVARDLVPVESCDDVLVERQAARGGGLAERRGPQQRGRRDAVARAPQRAEALHGDLRREAPAGRVVVGRLVEVEHGLEAR